jgi:hypothetical protein
MSATSPDLPDRERLDSPPREARIDLHCHSRYSTSANMWLTAELGFEESHTEPEAVYGLAKLRGMTHVTLTDHDSIEGALRLAHHEDFIIGEEVTAFFPSEALHVHVLVWGIDERQHEEIRELRFNLFEFVPYLREQAIAHALAHPFSLVAGSLRAEQLESLLVLFDVWEVRNGLSCRAENELAAGMVARSAVLRAGIAGAPQDSTAGPIGACAGSSTARTPPCVRSWLAPGTPAARTARPPSSLTTASPCCSAAVRSVLARCSAASPGPRARP